MRKNYLCLLKAQINANTYVDNTELFIQLQKYTDAEFEALINPDITKFASDEYIYMRTQFSQCCKKALENINNSDDIYWPIFWWIELKLKDSSVHNYLTLMWKNVEVSLDDILEKSIEIAKNYYRKYINGKEKGFIEWMYCDGYDALIEEYPLILIQINSLIEENIYLVKECLSRVLKNKREIKTTFDIDVEEKILDISFNVSDRHYQGKCVVIIKYPSGNLVYKPRNMSVDLFWCKVATWLSEGNNDISVCAAKVLAKGDYGFAEWIRPDNVIQDEENVRKFVYRSGNLIGIVSLLGGSDFHYENLICSNYTPVLIDMESLILPCKTQMFSTDQENVHLDVFKQTQLMRTLLLPKWVGNTPETAMDIGGLSAELDSAVNIPKRNNQKPIVFGEYPELLLKGYEDVLLYVCNHKEEYINLIEDIKKIKVRYILRNTRIYYKLIKYLSNPIYLKDANAYKSAACRLFAPYLLIGNKMISEKMWSIAKYEYDELLNCHIPMFSIKGDSRDLMDPEDVVLLHGYFCITPHEYVKQTVEVLTVDSIDKFKKYLSSVILIHTLQRSPSYDWNTSYFDVKREWLMPPNNYSINDYCVKMLNKISEAIKNNTINAELQLYYDPIKDPLTGRYSIEPMKDSLYSGRYGVQIYLEMFFNYFGIKHDQELLENYVYRMAKEFVENTMETKWFQLSLTEGLAGLLLLLRNFAIISGKRIFKDILFQLIQSVPSEYISRSEETDYYNGVSGLLYIICNSYDYFNEIPTENVKQTIEKSVVWILHQRSDNGFWDQEEYYYQPLTGLAHGQIGYALALSEAIPYIKNTLKNTVEKQIVECVRYETNCFDLEAMNLPDYRKLHKKKPTYNTFSKRFMYGYCSGILGTTLAIIHLPVSIVCHEKQNWWKENAKRYLLKSAFVGNDSLCCGVSGWIDYLSYYKEDEWASTCARKIINSIYLQKSVLNGLTQVDEVSLYKGLSGIGYSLLRFLGNYPSVLL